MKSGLRIQANRADIKVTNNSSPEIVDWDEDGLLDLLVGSDVASDGVRLYLNSGSKTQHQFTNYTTLEADGQKIGLRREQIQVGDINYDGKKDLLVGNGLVKESRIYYYENIGTNAAPVLAKAVALKYKTGSFIYPAGGYDIYYCLGDWNADGGLDILWTDYYGDVGMKLCLGDVPVAIDNAKKNKSENILKGYNLNQERLSVDLFIRNEQHVKLRITSVKGIRVGLKDIGIVQAGYNSIGYDLSELSSGTYFIQIIADGMLLEQKKLLFMK